MPRLLSVNVGLPQDIAWQGKIVHTAVWKTQVQGRRMVRRLNIDGDGQGDLAGHGGEHRAVFVYQIDAYRYWQHFLGRSDFVYGQFGENFTVDGLPDDEVCIGDRYRIGDAMLEVTQPRVTCYRVGIRMNEPQMAALLVAHNRPGFYFRVLQEGDIGAGDDIERIAAGPERMTVSEVNALLYKPGHPISEIERALRIKALSAGWRTSFQALLDQAQSEGAVAGNPGLTAAAGPPPAWAGFRPLAVSRKDRESASVISLTLEPTDGHALATALPGQFVVLRLRPTQDAPALFRSYSLSGTLRDDRYRLGIKRELHGAAGTYIDAQVRVGDVLDVSAPRGGFTLRPGSGPVILLSAGIGLTPVLAMLHALAAGNSPREVWWLYGARNGDEHPFAAETRTLLKALQRSHSHIRYSAPAPEDRPGVEFDAPGHVDMRAIAALGVPREGDFYLCGPAAFMDGLAGGLEAWGVVANRIHTERFGSSPSKTPGIAMAACRPPHAPAGPAGDGPLVSFARSGLTIRWAPSFQNLLELAEACDVPVRWSCRTGVCHSCETGLISGAVGYRPEPLDPPASGNTLICCGQPRGDIVLDL
ncbi:MAG TPA: MOSC and FAD-binding oxidoreductase domain-containing protein [Acidocella sp.]|jgi:ferredoxin-NADP reductase/MOSC domain-containing protein YiiM|uniref:MOSC and FAD-binding oxidoreductase domain-containing protein n=1 Tax=Acidocella sp. TaxID=50710 RepID=UPI002C3A4E86|nr:MOSC and FAD-binding oxidoreductase domain-containing protein [Acidocella sp.]HVE22206.1 MOSC and FAD-binding oxidoreductase domain-containing protein [Acidocella sp.]